jgi:DNA-binding transcriptional ArsR family regulator
MAKVLQHIEYTEDRRTGEIATIRKSFSVKSKTREEFFMVFLSGLNAICSLSRPSDIKILACLCERAEYNTGVVRLTPEDRQELIKKLEISSQAFSNSLTRLRTAGLIDGSRGGYEVNPQHFWKGETNERGRLLKAKSLDLLTKYRQDGFED